MRLPRLFRAKDVWALAFSILLSLIVTVEMLMCTEGGPRNLHFDSLAHLVILQTLTSKLKLISHPEALNSRSMPYIRRYMN